MSDIERSFKRIGARADVICVPKIMSAARQKRRPWNGSTQRGENPPVVIDIRRDGAGEYFDVERRSDVRLIVADEVPDDRHLLLIAQQPDVVPELHGRFLCGHDERSWFVAAIPESAAAMTVQQAKDALKPKEVWDSMADWNVPAEQRDLRCTSGFLRQGEWFFLPRPWMEVYAAYILRNEPIQRGGGKPHFCERIFRTEGEPVNVCDAYPNGLTTEEYRALDPVERRRHYWREMTRDANVFANGYVQHPDHETIVLPYWHKVVLNTETRARAMEDLAFLD